MEQKSKRVPCVSSILDDGSIAELVYDQEEETTGFVVWKDGECRYEKSLSHLHHVTLVPYAPTNNLIKNKVILFPSGPESYESEKELLEDIQAYIHRYVDVSPQFERIASAYVLLTWIYDVFKELPYLRLLGDWGTGKTRFLLTVGAICNKPIYASGASTVAPIFHILDSFQGTLLFDEADFRFSDERAEIVKILNNGNVKGVPVLRTRKNKEGEYNPRAFQVFGPKIVASRGNFHDPALESRFITEETSSRPVRKGIPVTLPERQEQEALHLRNQLLLYRFRNLHKRSVYPQLFAENVEARIKQIFVPLMSVVDDDMLRNELHDLAERYSSDITTKRSMGLEAQILRSIERVYKVSGDASIPLKAVTKEFKKHHLEEYGTRITSRWVGNIIRNKLQLRTQRSHGVYIIPREEFTKLNHLYEKFGVIEEEKNNNDFKIEPLGEDNGEDEPTIQI